MSINRDRGFELEDGILIVKDSVDAGHFSWGPNVPTHQGKANDIYLRTTDSTLWSLLLDGTDWVRTTGGTLFIGGVGANYTHLDEQCVGGSDANGD